MQLDGYAAMVASTVVVGATAAAPVTGRAADVVAATYYAAEIAARMIKPGTKVEFCGLAVVPYEDALRHHSSLVFA